MDSVCIGLTSSNRVTFAENATGFVLGLPTDVLWFELHKIRSTHRARPRLHRQQGIVPTSLRLVGGSAISFAFVAAVAIRVMRDLPRAIE